MYRQLATNVFKNTNSRSHYCGPLRALILDWSGTTIDAHVLAPAVVFVEVFKKHGVSISMQEARGPMGLRKDLHIAKLLENPIIKQRWTDIKGRKPTYKDVDVLFEDFVPMQLECLPQYTDLLFGVLETVASIREEFKVKIGTTTGFTAEMVDVILESTKLQGYQPDTSVAGDQVPHNMGFRPAPFMVYQNLLNLGISPIQSVVKVDDTVSGVGEGLNAGCWSVGIFGCSNYTDIDSIEQWVSMTPEEREERCEQSKEKLLESGAHYVIDKFDKLPSVMREIASRIVNGEKP